MCKKYLEEEYCLHRRKGGKVKLAAYHAKISSVKGEKKSSYVPEFQSQSDEFFWACKYYTNVKNTHLVQEEVKKEIADGEVRAVYANGDAATQLEKKQQEMKSCFKCGFLSCVAATVLQVL